MSYRLGLDALNLRPTDRLAHTEYCDHAELIRAVTGLPDGSMYAPAFCDKWHIDLRFHTNNGPVRWHDRGRVTDMGHAAYVEHGADKSLPQTCPFTDPEQVLAFDAVDEYGLPDFESLVEYYENDYDRGQRAHPESVLPGGYYRTMVSGAIETFGWEMLLLAAADLDRFDKVLDSFFRLTMHHVKAWARTSIECFICHDDMV